MVRAQGAALNFDGRSTLVDIFLWEGDAARAWSEAKARGCRRDLWMTLAETREEHHPADVTIL